MRIGVALFCFLGDIVHHSFKQTSITMFNSEYEYFKIKKSCLVYLQSRMEERLDDAIHVLRTHAEMPGMPPHLQGMMGGPGQMGPAGMMGNMGPMSGMGGMGSHIETLVSIYTGKP